MKKITIKIFSLSLFALLLTLNVSAQVKSPKNATQITPSKEVLTPSTKTPDTVTKPDVKVPSKTTDVTPKPTMETKPEVYDAKIEKRAAKLASKLGLVKQQSMDFQASEKFFLYNVRDIKKSIKDHKTAMEQVKPLYAEHLINLENILNADQIANYKKYTSRFIQKRKKIRKDKKKEKREKPGKIKNK